LVDWRVCLTRRFAELRMASLRTFLASPLARHPGLLVRKVVDRLGLRRSTGPLPEPSVKRVSLPAAWLPMLRSWLEAIPRHAGPYSFGRVFGQDFDEALLLELCAKGPRRGAKDLTGDIKLIWDFSRAHPLVLNAWEGAEHSAQVNAAFINRWLVANGNTDGPAWVCAMDVAIRAVNWIVADVLSRGALGRAVGESLWAAWLWRHGVVIHRRLESKVTPTNHYLADLLGLMVIGSVLPDDALARGWLRFARDEFPRALLTQTRADGGLNEASLRYHAFVAEIALLSRWALGERLGFGAEERLLQMVQILADFRDAEGDLFAFGDDDSGRVLAMDEASFWRRGDVLLRLAKVILGCEFKPSALAVYRESGWWIQRSGEFVVVLEFGGVGMRGLGAHAHNDDLSVSVEWNDSPVIVDPGTFLYTPDAAARNRFRSVQSHNTVIIDGAEPLKLSGELFHLPGRDAAWPSRELEGGGWSFTRSLAGRIGHQRAVTLTDGELEMRDELTGRGRHEAQWRFHLHPDWSAVVRDGGFDLVLGGVAKLRLEPGAAGRPLNLEVIPGRFSPGYGRECAIQVCEARALMELPVTVEWRLRVASTAAGR
jgi:Heparinase II/III-like protein